MGIYAAATPHGPENFEHKAKKISPRYVEIPNPAGFSRREERQGKQVNQPTPSRHHTRSNSGAERHEKIVYDLRREIETVRESLEAAVAVAEDAAHAAMEKARKREKDLQAELATARGAVETAAASTLQRVFNKRWTRVLQERYHL